VIERLPEIDEDEFDDEAFWRGKGSREEQRKIVRRVMAGIINNPSGYRQIWEEEHGKIHIPKHHHGRRVSRGQRNRGYLQAYLQIRQIRVEPPKRCIKPRVILQPKPIIFEHPIQRVARLAPCSRNLPFPFCLVRERIIEVQKLEDEKEVIEIPRVHSDERVSKEDSRQPATLEPVLI